MLIKLGFDPTVPYCGPDVSADERELVELLHWMFAILDVRNSLPLKFWCFWKRRYMTSQHFLPFIANLWNKQKEDERSLWLAYGNIDEFFVLLRQAGLDNNTGLYDCAESRRYIMQNWQLFNPSIRTAIRASYEVVDDWQVAEPETKIIVIH